MDRFAPHVLVIGGFLTEPINYRPFRRRLLERGAARVDVAPVHLPDYAVMPLVGMGPLLLRAARAIREARRRALDPIMVIGHSMGGMLARLAMAPAPLDGRIAAVADDVAALVMLATPHRLTPMVPWRHPGVRALEHLDRVSPGAWFSPGTGYLTVGSTLTRPARRAPVRSLPQLLNRGLLAFVGEPDGPGDGLVANEVSRLDGVRHLAYPDVRHGTLGAPWYGNDEVLDRWWPVALATWRDALAARTMEVPAA